jgi:hypothetical protein
LHLAYTMSARTTAVSAAIAACLLVFVSPASVATPSISEVVGPLNHKATITIGGSGFGAKPTAAPLAWDDASGSGVAAIWSGAWPDKIAPYNLEYRTPQRGISLPHNHISRYIAGAHAEKQGADGGSNVMMFKAFTLPPSFPAYLYVSWYQRADDHWVFGQDNNFKTFDYSIGGEPYGTEEWYTGYGPPHPDSRTDGAGWGPNDAARSAVGRSLINPDMNGHSFWWNQGVNPMSGKWSKVEFEVKLTDQNDGFIRVVENGSHVLINYMGPTDRYTGKDRTVAIGGYARMTGEPTNWRYYADVYVDTTLARVVLANNANLSKATIVETQVPATWSDSSISATVNLGQFSQGQTAYLFVFDATGTANAAGIPVTAGSGAIAGQPNPPGDVNIH